MDEIIKFLETNGFTETQGINNPSGNIVRLPGNRFSCTKYSLRRKFYKDDWRITIGARTVCLYLVLNREVKECYQFKTKEVEKIKEKILQLTGGTND